jgi:hypothetical protein
VKDATVLPAAILVTLLAFFANSFLSRPDPLVPATAPATVFSGERGMDLLRQFLVENVSHPVGSAENRRVKGRIQAWLDAQGIAHEEQVAWGCREKEATCSHVENIIATLPGDLPGPYVALMAHYDSVPPAAGAGDDMAGVVAVLETARALQAVGGLRHPILLLITDSEETGLHGAAAFFDRHPLAEQVGVILNVEGSGTRGHSLVLRTAGDNAWYMKLFKHSAAQPAGTSLANEVFRRMPNDTDFSISRDADVPGIDFAFAAERNHYHTPNDNADNLDPRTIQHHGDNLFPLALQLANSDLDAQQPGSVVYNASYGSWWQWPAALSPVLLGLTGLLLLLASWRAGTTPLRLLLLSLPVPIAVLVAGGALVHLCFLLLDRLLGTTVSWPAHLWPLRAIVFAGVLLPALLAGRWLCARVSVAGVLLGGWWFLWLLTALLVLFLPDAAAALLVAVVPAAAMLAVAAWIPMPEPARTSCQLATLLFSSLFLGAARTLEETQGYRLFFAVWPWVGLFAVTAIAFARGRWLGAFTAATGAALAASLVAASLLPLYSEHRPQHLNVYYVQGEAMPEAMLHVWTEGALPAPMPAAAAFLAAGRPIVPWSSEPWQNLAPVVSASLPPPSLIVEDSRQTDSGRELRLRLSSNRQAWRMRLYLPASARTTGARIDGQPIRWTASVDPDSDRYRRLTFFGVQDHDVVVTLTLDSSDPVDAFLVDYTSQLPAPAQGLLDARPPTAAPVHSGDLAIVYTAVRL